MKSDDVFDVIAKGIAEKIGLPAGILQYAPTGKDKIVTDLQLQSPSTTTFFEILTRFAADFLSTASKAARARRTRFPLTTRDTPSFPKSETVISRRLNKARKDKFPFSEAAESE